MGPLWVEGLGFGLRFRLLTVLGIEEILIALSLNDCPTIISYVYFGASSQVFCEELQGNR